MPGVRGDGGEAGKYGETRAFMGRDQMGPGVVPVVRIGSTVIRGYNPDAVMSSLGRYVSRKSRDRSLAPHSPALRTVNPSAAAALLRTAPKDEKVREMS